MIVLVMNERGGNRQRRAQKRNIIKHTPLGGGMCFGRCGYAYEVDDI